MQHIFKDPRSQFGHTHEGGGVKISQENLNNCVIKYKLYLPCASFEENCAQTTTFSIKLFNLRRNHFLVYRTEKGFTSVFIHFSSFKICFHTMFKSQHHSITLLHGDKPLNYSLDNFFHSEKYVLLSL